MSVAFWYCENAFNFTQDGATEWGCTGYSPALIIQPPLALSCIIRFHPADLPHSLWYADFFSIKMNHFVQSFLTEHPVHPVHLHRLNQWVWCENMWNPCHDTRRPVIYLASGLSPWIQLWLLLCVGFGHLRDRVETLKDSASPIDQFVLEQLGIWGKWTTPIRTYIPSDWFHWVFP